MHSNPLSHRLEGLQLVVGAPACVLHLTAKLSGSIPRVSAPSGDFVVTGSRDWSAKLWDPSGEHLWTLR